MPGLFTVGSSILGGIAASLFGGSQASTPSYNGPDLFSDPGPRMVHDYTPEPVQPKVTVSDKQDVNLPKHFGMLGQKVRKTFEDRNFKGKLPKPYNNEDEDEGKRKIGTFEKFVIGTTLFQLGEDV